MVASFMVDFGWLHMASDSTLFLSVKTSGYSESNKGQINLNDVSN